YSFWYEQNFNSRLSVRAGLMSADSQFLQSRTAANFINNGISWPTFLAANLPAGGPAYPLPAPGVRVRFRPAEGTSSRSVQRRSQRRQRLQSSRAASDRHRRQLSRRGLFHRGGELFAQPGQGCQRASWRLQDRSLVSYQPALRRSALRQYRPLARE